MNTDRQGLDSLPVCVMENTGTRRTLQWQKNVNLCREFRILAGIAGKEFYSVFVFAEHLPFSIFFARK